MNLTFVDLYREFTLLYSPTTIIHPGQSTYVTYIPNLDCVSGTFSGCSGDGYPDNTTIVTACTPPQGVSRPDICTEGPHGCLSGGNRLVTSENATQVANVTCQSCGNAIPTMFQTTFNASSASTSTTSSSAGSKAVEAVSGGVMVVAAVVAMCVI